MQDTRRHDVPDDTCNDLREQLDSYRQGLEVLHFLHEEREPEVGGEEGHHAEDGREDELGFVRGSVVRKGEGTYEGEVAVFPDVEGHQGMRPVAFPECKSNEEEEADD